MFVPAWFVASYLVLWLLVLCAVVLLVGALRQVGLLERKLSTAMASPGVETQGPPLDQPAPEFESEDLNGNRITLGDLRGFPALLTFVSPTCQPCHDVIPGIEALHRESGGDFRLVYVSAASRDANELMAKTLQMGGSILPDVARQVFRVFNNSLTPFGVMLDSDGIVRGRGALNTTDKARELVALGRVPAAA